MENYLKQSCHMIRQSSVQFSHSVVSDSLWPHESQHARPPCSSPTPKVHSNSRPSSQWCHPAISSSVVPFLLPPIPPSIRVFSMNQLLARGGQSTGVSALASFLPKNTQDWLCSNHELLTANSHLKKVGENTRPFRYDLNQIPYDYTVEVTNRFKG